MKILKITFRFLWTYLLISFLFGCNSAEKRWEVINQSDSISVYISFIKEFPKNSYGDSAILKIEKKLYSLSLINDSIGSIGRYNDFIVNYPKVEKLVDVNSRIDSILAHKEKIVFLRSNKSITRNETFIFYEELITKYPKIKDIIDVDEKLEFLKQKADTIEVIGKLVSKEGNRISSVPIILVPITEDGQNKWVFDNGFLQNPRVKTDSLGNFKMVFHKTFLEDMWAFTLNISDGISYNSIKNEEDEQIFFKIDSTTRIFQISEITVL